MRMQKEHICEEKEVNSHLYNILMVSGIRIQKMTGSQKYRFR